MTYVNPAHYDKRPVKNWLQRANEGTISLPDFQRSYVWNNQRIANYLKALFQNRPTGVFLILPIRDEPQFVSRPLMGINVEDGNPTELVLDGQQRLTSLWHALRGTPDHQFFVEVSDLSSREMDVSNVHTYSTRSSQYRVLREPAVAYDKNLVPIDILWEDMDENNPERDELGKIWDWSNSACSTDSDEARRLERAIGRLQKEHLLNRELHYCALPPETSKQEAIDVFIETNSSSVTVKRFDIVVATAQRQYEEHLRQCIEDFHNDNDLTSNYFKGDEQETIPEIGEWILKVACLKVRTEQHPLGLPPKEANYEKALTAVFASDQDSPRPIDSLLIDLKFALATAAKHGGVTHRTLASWPPVHVVAGIQEELKGVEGTARSRAARVGTANKLISTYLWRAFLTDRYEVQANDRLYEDYKQLRQCLFSIRNTGTTDESMLPPMLNDSLHPLPSEDDLLDTAWSWIGLKSRRGRAIAAITLANNPKDWATGETLDTETVRSLENSGELERHHVFPKDFLKEHIDVGRINLGLNGVVLKKITNRSFSRNDPALYMNNLLNQSSVTDSELRQRVETHLVPYELLVSSGDPESRYEVFLSERAKIMIEKINELAVLP